MISSLVEILEKAIEVSGWMGVFFASLAEEIIAFIPSPIVQFGAGFILLGGQPQTLENYLRLFFEVVLPISAGVTLGSAVFYYFAFYLGKPAIIKWGHYFNFNWQSVEKTQNYFNKGWLNEIIIFGTRAIPIFPNAVINVVAGLIRIKPFSFFFFTFLGTIFRASLQGYLGWQLGSIYKVYAENIGKYEKYCLIAIVFLIVGLFAYYYFRPKKSLLKP